MALRSSAASRGIRKQAQLAAQRLDACPQRAALVLGERAHLAVGAGIGDQRLRVGELALGVGQRARLLRHRIELGESSRDSRT